MSDLISVYVVGGTSILSQSDRIKQGLNSLPGVQVTDYISDADLVYSNDAGHFSSILEDKAKGRLKPGARLVFNVLDIPLHLLPPSGDYAFEKVFALAEQLKQADAVTAISQYVQSQIQQYLGLPSTVIYNPIKDVSPSIRLSGARPYPFRALMVGRCLDSNKRIRSLGIPSLIAAGFDESEVAVVGGEYPGWGVNLGIVRDDVLNDLYNSVDYVMYPSMLEGMGLPPLEGMICGAVPIVCSDLTTISEFPYPRFWWCYPSPQAIAYHLRIRGENPQVLEADRQHCLTLSEGLAEDLGKVAVARRIIEVYKRLVS